MHSHGGSRTCDSSDCRCRSTVFTCTYAFPRWFWESIVTLRIASMGPEPCIRVVRVRPDSAKISKAVRVDDRMEGVAIHHIQILLENGQASLLDVDVYGRTPLQVRSKQSSTRGPHCDIKRSWLLGLETMTPPHS